MIEFRRSSCNHIEIRKGGRSRYISNEEIEIMWWLQTSFGLTSWDVLAMNQNATKEWQEHEAEELKK